MSQRIDYLNDPDAPKANSMVPSVNVVVVDTEGRLLLIRRSDNGNWALPGGAIDVGESLAQAGVREVQEETGIVCEITGLVGIYTNPNHVLHYTSNDEVRQECSIVLTAVPVSGEVSTSSESTAVEWAYASDLAGYRMHPSMQDRVDRFLAGAAAWPEIS
ncbi:MAG: NUDIX hydrolase [Sporichthyaceae bacterium]